MVRRDFYAPCSASLIQALLRSMFPQQPRAACMDKSLFKTAELEAITQSARRCPAFFDDVTAKQMGLTGKDFIKNETPLGLGWWIDADAGRLVVRERVNQYGQSPFTWDQVPSTIIDADASSSGHTSLVMSELNKFLPDWKPRSPEPTASFQEEPATPRPRRRRFGFRRRRTS